MKSAEQAIRVLDRLVKVSPNSKLAERASKMRDRLKATPMTDILDQVLPGQPVAAKAKAVGVSRQTFYYWLNGETRPNRKQAKRIHTLTGVDTDEIRGYAA